MKSMDIEMYNKIRGGGIGIYEQPRGLIAVWGKEAVQFLDGLISNNVKALEDGAQMLAAFPNAQGRLIAIVRVLRQGHRFLIETEEATRKTVFNNLHRFTFAGDFFVEEVSTQYRFSHVWNFEIGSPETVLRFRGRGFTTWAIPHDEYTAFNYNIVDDGGFIQTPTKIYSDLTHPTFEALRIEAGVPIYGIDMDETTIVPELGLDGLISYNKGCYIGQEIIARIHFRGHVAKSLTGLVSEPGAVETKFLAGAEIVTVEGKNAGRITSSAYSPKLGRSIALAYVRYDHLAEGTELTAGDHRVAVAPLPFI